ncbi:hypothetical protein [uncultured Vagococcus sp.]|uniref:hypothetical protein n=1 Tax=uncultured Vagococcus sp. TaxID=189676 RepID=UPI0028D2B716|nr:hypothetical protein [uncultured Vagococcus sp.]
MINVAITIYVLGIILFSSLAYRLKSNDGYQDLNRISFIKNMKDDYQTFIAKAKMFAQYTLSFLTSSTMIFSSGLIVSLLVYSLNPTQVSFYIMIILAISLFLQQFFLARLLVKTTYLKKLIYLRTHD